MWAVNFEVKSDDSFGVNVSRDGEVAAEIIVHPKELTAAHEWGMSFFLSTFSHGAGETFRTMWAKVKARV